MQEWLEEHKEEVVDNIVEEVLDGAGLVKEIKTCHLDDEDENEDEDDDEDEDDHGVEDVDADEDEDSHSSPHFFKKDNGPDVEMGENAALGGPLEEAMDDDEDVYPQLPNIFNEKLHWNEQELVLGMRHWQVVSCGIMEFKTRKIDESYIVDVIKKECSCRLWQLNGGMNGMNMWPSTTFTPPLSPLKRRMPGRPTVIRIRDAFERSGKHIVSEARKKVYCDIFKEKGHNKTTCTKVPRPPKTNVTKKQKIMQTQESVNMQGGGEDVVMGDAVEPQTDEVMRVKKSDQVVRVNEAKERGRFNRVVRQVNTTGQPSKRKKSERILKLKLGKRVEGEGSSVGSPMELD
ncbi:unnamed protein product [Lactuca virosa]|uniref:Transposase MuDR plant domain-containing protein n=1 Tax=Lactuca virosa TaxID=75947 RepID=A0AAU9N1P2_9ASTR|nr:unnamed protein product [Lactuca virosa]